MGVVGQLEEDGRDSSQRVRLSETIGSDRDRVEGVVRSIREPLAAVGRVLEWIGSSLALVGGMVLYQLLLSVDGWRSWLIVALFLAVPFGVFLLLVGWALRIWGRPLEDRSRQRGRVGRWIGASLVAVASGLLVLAAAAGFAEDVETADVLGIASFIMFGAGTLAVVVGVILSLIAEHRDTATTPSN
jgi:MFS family permease